MLRWPSRRWILAGRFYASPDETAVKPVSGTETLIIA
jgi:hypothetical protein